MSQNPVFQCPNAGLLRCGFKMFLQSQFSPLFQCPNAGLLRCGVRSQRHVRSVNTGFSALTLGFFDVATGTADFISSAVSFSALTLGFFDVAPRQAALGRLVQGFSALTLGFFDVALGGLCGLLAQGVSVP